MEQLQLQQQLKELITSEVTIEVNNNKYTKNLFTYTFKGVFDTIDDYRKAYVECFEAFLQVYKIPTTKANGLRVIWYADKLDESNVEETTEGLFVLNDSFGIPNNILITV